MEDASHSVQASPPGARNRQAVRSDEHAQDVEARVRGGRLRPHASHYDRGMGSVLLAACPFTGHVRPTVQLAAGLVAAGHRVRVLTGARFAQSVQQVGAVFLPLPTAADLDESDLSHRFPERASLDGVAAARFDMQRIFLDPMPAQLHALDAALAEEPAEVVVAEPLFLAAWPFTDRLDSPPVVTLGTMPPLSQNDAMPPVGTPLTWLGPLAAPFHRAMHRVSQRALFGSVQAHGQHLLRSTGVRPPDHLFLDWPRAAAGLVQLSIPTFEPISGWPSPVHFVGALTETPSASPGVNRRGLDEKDQATVDQAVANGVPVVHVTQGTAITSDFEQLLLPTLRALADRPVLVVATTGGRDTASLGRSLPANAVVRPWVDYDALLPKVSVMVTNGGYGGVHEALRHGIPLVLAGAQQDKAAIGTRLRRSGAGVAVASLTPGEGLLDRMVGEVLVEPRYRDPARRLAVEMAAAPGVAGAVAAVEGAARAT